MAVAKKLYRSDDAVVAGVCAGLADCFDIDPAAMRILTVLMTASTFGLFALVYLSLWLILPKHVVMAPEPIPYTVYASRLKDGPPGQGPFADSSQEGKRGSSGKAPVPPVGFYAAHGPEQGAHVGEGAPSSAVRPGCFAYVAPCSKTPTADESEQASDRGLFDLARFCVWMGLCVLFVVSVVVLGVVTTDISWWRFWPVALVFAGFTLMTMPSLSFRMVRFSVGFSLFSLGGIITLMSVGLLSWETATVAFSRLWPMAFVIGGLAIIGLALREELFVLAVAICVFIACVIAATVFAVPGTLDSVAISIPFGDARIVDINPWM